jgi:hypothetical protein
MWALRMHFTMHPFLCVPFQHGYANDTNYKHRAFNWTSFITKGIRQKETGERKAKPSISGFVAGNADKKSILLFPIKSGRQKTV